MATDIGSFVDSRWLAALGLGLVHSVWQASVIAAAAALVLREIRETHRYVVAYAALMMIPGVCAVTVWRIAAGPPSSFVLPLAGLEAMAPWIGCAWIAGTGAASVRLAAGWLRLQRLRASALPVPESWQAAADAVRGRLGVARAVRLVETRLADVPGVIGWAAPMLLFPAGLLAGFPPGQVQLILAHELAHVRRNDFVWNVVQTAIETVFFFHPAVWWLSHRVRAERELCCDDLVVAEFGDRQLYAEALTSLERRRAAGWAALAPAASGGDLLGRIQRLIDRPREPKRATPLPIVAAAAIALMAMAMSGADAGAASAAAIQSSVWLGAIFGFVVGARHAFEPDHLVAISTLVTGERTTLRSAHMGMSWGLGHTLTLFIVAGALALVRVNMPEGAAAAIEAVVGLMLVGLGLRALRSAMVLATKGPEAWHEHGGSVHRHRTSAAHVHVGRFALARRPFAVGMVHGLAGSGALAALAMTTMPTTLVQVVFIVLFGLGSTLGMAALSGLAGLPLARLARRPAALAWASAAVGVVSVVAGVAWGAPIFWGWM